MFQIGDAYKGRTNNFVVRVIKKPIEELNSVGLNFFVEAEIVRRGGGRKIRGVILKCKEKAVLKSILKTDPAELKKAKKESNLDRLRLEQAKQNPMWDKVSSEILALAKANKIFIANDLMLDIAIFSEMQKRGFVE